MDVENTACNDINIEPFRIVLDFTLIARVSREPTVSLTLMKRPLMNHRESVRALW